MIEATPKAPTLNAVYETTTCSRCGGGGNYSYCAMYGTTCFGCAGSGKKYTKRGLATKKYIESLRNKAAGDLVAGDRIKIPGYKSFQTVETVKPDPHNAGYVIVKCKAISLHTPPASLQLTQIKDQAEMDRLIAIAREYQDSLTKNGTVRKVR